MKSNQCDAENKFTFLLQKLLVLKRLPSAKIAEQTKEQFRTFLNETVSLEYESFNCLINLKTELVYSLAITRQQKSIAMFSQYFS